MTQKHRRKTSLSFGGSLGKAFLFGVAFASLFVTDCSYRSQENVLGRESVLGLQIVLEEFDYISARELFNS